MAGCAHCAFMSAEWTDPQWLSKENVERLVRSEAGVYRMSRQEANGEFTVFYAGQAQDLRGRLLQHLSASEPNTCIRRRVREERCAFRVAYVGTQGERDEEEHIVIHTFDPECNKQQP